MTDLQLYKTLPNGAIEPGDSVRVYWPIGATGIPQLCIYTAGRLLSDSGSGHILQWIHL